MEIVIYQCDHYSGKGNLAVLNFIVKIFWRSQKELAGFDIAVVGIGGFADENNRQWLDMLTERDFSVLKSEEKSEKLCCLLFW